mgnify:CR=1 FL=1
MNSLRRIFPILVGCILVGLGLSLRFDENHLFLGSYKLPELCVYKNIFQVECFGCGLTRSIVLALKGEILKSLSMHYMGIPVLITLFCTGVKTLLSFNVNKKRQGENYV